MKVFVLGLDGATFDILDPLMQEGFMPNLKSIRDNHVSGRMKTIMPPVTGPAWLALATGLNPGKTGVFDYINRASKDSDQMVPVSSKYYDNRAIWNMLNEAGYKTGIFNYPTLVPAPEVDGFVVGGIGASWENKNLFYPQDMINEIQEIVGDYKVLLNLRNPEYKKNIDFFFRDIHDILDKQILIMQHLITKKKWDFFFGVLSVTDWVQHVVWKDIDENHPLYNDAESPKIHEKFKDFWRSVDQNIGSIIELLPDNTNLLFVSDHGFGQLNSVFYPNSWLEKKNWLTKKKGMTLKQILTNKLGIFSESFDNKYSNAMIQRFKKRILKIDSAIDFIDFENTLAYSPEHNTMYGCINLTKKGKKIDGFKNKLIDSLKDLPNEFKEINSVEIVLPEQVYNGPFTELSPDIYFILNNYEATVEIPFNKKIFSTKPSVLLRTGSHRSEGIFMAKGEVFKKNEVNPSIMDIAPTILALFGIEKPSALDGQVLNDCLKENKKGKTTLSGKKDQSGKKNEETDEAELEKMKKMLKSLGYL
jgi:predicted AlkP superfamily phosphohydrolase/phosphomutase